METLREECEQRIQEADKVRRREQDEAQQEFESRLGTAMRKVYALTKEGDSLKRAAAKSIQPSVLEEKNLLVQQVCFVPLISNLVSDHYAVEVCQCRDVQ